MYRRKRILLLSSSIILLCACLIAGATFALFTEDATVTTHLKAGELEATLVRKAGYYTVLNDKGVLERYQLEALEVDFTEPTEENFFGDVEDKLIVPLSSFEAIFEIGNKGTTAFTYDVEIVPKDKDAQLADQLWVEIGTATPDGNGGYTYTKLSDGWLNDGSYKLSDKEDGAAYNNLVEANATKDSTSGLLYARVTFADDREHTELKNNEVQGLSVNFDLVVTATQYTEIVNG